MNSSLADRFRPKTIEEGAWVKSSDYGSKLNILGGADEGYSILFAKPSGWLEKYYLEPIPTQEIALNPKLKQNPGWETAE